MMSYTPALLGGILIGLSSLFMLYLLGRLTGISNIIWGAVSQAQTSLWRWCFLSGLVAGTFIYHYGFHMPMPAASQQHWGFALVAGLLVGMGVKLGSGCTSGHGVCGIGRLSLRSIVATLVFMASGIITVFFIRHGF